MRRLVLGVAVGLAACSVSPSPAEAPVPPESVRSELDGANALVRVDRERHQVTVLLGPFQVPEVQEPAGGHVDHGGGHHEGGTRTPLIPFEWPVDAGFQGFTVRVFDGEGNLLPRRIMHHMIAVNFGRRQLVYPVAERLFGVGTETADVRLPDFLEVPLSRGDRIGVYAMWHNESGAALPEVYAQIIMPFAPENGEEREAVLPFYVDTNNRIGGSTTFDLPPGKVTKSYEFSLQVGGGLLAASGHLHDYGRNVRLEDAETGEVLVHLKSELDEDGKIHGIETRVFRRLLGLMDDRVELEAGRRYRVVGEYYNPTADTLRDAAMAHIVGLFAPEDYGAWPELDTTAEAYRKDLTGLPAARDESGRQERPEAFRR